MDKEQALNVVRAYKAAIRPKTSSVLWRVTMDVDTAIEPVLMEERHPSPLFEDVMVSGVAV